MIELQETYDFVVNFLRKQGKQSKDESTNTCLYRGPDNTKCAAGCLIPDDQYEKEFEGWPIADDDKSRPTIYAVGRLIQKLGHDVNLVRALQQVHDGLKPEEWEDAFRGVAVKFGLKWRRPEEQPV